MSEKKRPFWQRWFGSSDDQATPPEPQMIPEVKIERSSARSTPSVSMSTDEAETAVDPIYLRQQMSNHLDLSQIHALARQFGVGSDHLSGGKGRQVLQLIQAVEQNGQLPALLAACQELNPDLTWQLS